MERVPYLHVMPRVDKDIKECLQFVESHPWGKPQDRALDIRSGIEQALTRPESSRVAVRRPKSGLELRQCIVAQFAIVYAYFKAADSSKRGVVSIRAVRHVRVRDVFEGVKEPTSEYLVGPPAIAPVSGGC